MSPTVTGLISSLTDWSSQSSVTVNGDVAPRRPRQPHPRHCPDLASPCPRGSRVGRGCSVRTAQGGSGGWPCGRHACVSPAPLRPVGARD